VIDDVYFLTVEEVVAIHADQIARYGGDAGLRDRGLLESAVHAAEHVAAYGESFDLYNHQNGVGLDDPDERLCDLMIGIATKAIGKTEIAAILRSLVVPVSD